MKEVTIRKKLSGLGLSERQATIYLSLVNSGPTQIGSLVTFTKIPRSTVYEDLKRLSALGLIEEITDEKRKLIKAHSLKSLANRIEAKISDLHDQVSDIDDLDEAIAKQASSSLDPAVVVRYFKGRSGAQQLLWNTLKAKQTVFVYSEWGRGQFVGVNFYRRFVADSAERKISEQVLINPSARALKSIQQHLGSPLSRTKLSQIRAVDSSDIQINGESFIYDNIYAQIFLKDNVISGFEVESSKFVAMQRSMFASQWQSAQPVAKLLKKS